MAENKSSGQNSIVLKIEEVAAPLCLSENIELVHVEVLSSSHDVIVRVSIDKPYGVTIDDCAFISRQLGDLMDVHLEDMGAYRLEVASPGPRRPLKKKADYERFKGQKIRIETVELINGRKRFTGILNGFIKGHVELVVDTEVRAFQLEQISKARLA
ncbi:MAG: ribosome maturation factor RimP [Thermodesulfobacteriota bacterium]|nr:ribosome maturation factor RimP [Thermodesulfobacteriota bacterium]